MIMLLRIDDRLIHAQVVLGWGRVLRPDRIVIADDGISTSEWEMELYMSAASPDIKTSILSLRNAVDHIKGGVFERENIFLIVKSPSAVLDLMDLGLDVDEVNVGGLHYKEGKEKYLDNVYLGEEDRGAMRELVKRGVTLEARALPDEEPVILNSRVV